MNILNQSAWTVGWNVLLAGRGKKKTVTNQLQNFVVECWAQKCIRSFFLWQAISVLYTDTCSLHWLPASFCAEFEILLLIFKEHGLTPSCTAHILTVCELVRALGSYVTCLVRCSKVSKLLWGLCALSSRKGLIWWACNPQLFSMTFD